MIQLFLRWLEGECGWLIWTLEVRDSRLARRALMNLMREERTGAVSQAFAALRRAQQRKENYGAFQDHYSAAVGWDEKLKNLKNMGE